MSTQSLQETTNRNPFEDPSLDTESVLSVSRDATLTLGTDALIVFDESLRRRSAAQTCFGLFLSRPKTTQAIPFHHILWAELAGINITVHYASPTGGGAKARKVRYIHYDLPDQKLEQAQKWVDKLVQRAYPSSTKKRRRMKVLVNPFGGQGNARKIWTKEAAPIFAAARCDIDVETTTHQGHAVEIAKNLDLDAYDAVVCASGDGLPHEVFNGLAQHKHARRALRRIAVCQLPCGSGNAMCLNLTGTVAPSAAALEIVKGIPTHLDLVAITQGTNKYYSFLSQAVGIVAESDLGTDSLRWMGPVRFTWGFLVRILGKTQYPAELSVVTECDDKHVIRDTYRRAVEHHLTRREAPNADADTIETEDDEDDDDSASLPPLQYGTVLDPLPPAFTTQDLPTLGNFYAGKMCYMSPDAPFFSTALPLDGQLDVVTIAGDIPRRTAIAMLFSVATGALMTQPEVQYRKLRAYRVVPRRAPHQRRPGLRTRLGKWLSGAGAQTDGLIAVDGESVPFEPFQAEVVPRLGTVLSKRGPLYEWYGSPL